jgi:hypothetical protein
METELKLAARLLEVEMQCTCDLDRWEPDRRTGHSSVCQIHKAAIAAWNTRKEPEEG